MIANSTLALAAFALMFSDGCDSVITINSDGNIQVAIHTWGPDPDPDGYSLTVDGDLAYVLPAAGSLDLQLAPGNHSVQLGGLAANCSVDGVNPLSIVVDGRRAADVSFSVVCSRNTAR